jgi:hypothetical protein
VSVLRLAVAGVPVHLDLAGLAGASPRGLERYLPFADATPGARWRFALRPGPAEPLSLPERRTAPGPDGRWQLPGLEAEGSLDPRSGQGFAFARPGLDALDALLRAAVGTVVLERGGFLVHGACLAVDGRAHLFPARSGSGKSTLAQTAGHPLSDELSVLLPAEAGDGFVAHATPWWTSRGGAAPLAAVYGLSWDGEEVTWLPGSALRQLSANLVVPIDTPAARAQALAAAARAARGVRWGQLRFRPGSDVDALLRAAW